MDKNGVSKQCGHNFSDMSPVVWFSLRSAFNCALRMQSEIFSSHFFFESSHASPLLLRRKNHLEWLLYWLLTASAACCWRWWLDSSGRLLWPRMSDDGFVTLMHHFTEKELGIILMDPRCCSNQDYFRAHQNSIDNALKEAAELLSLESSSRNPTTSEAAKQLLNSVPLTTQNLLT